VPELATQRTVSRSAYLELQQELELVKNGYEFLDEKRILLAAEILRQRDSYRGADHDFVARCDEAAQTLLDAAADQGLDSLQAWPAVQLTEARLRIAVRQYVGESLLSARFETGAEGSSRPPVSPSRAVRRCGDSFRRLLQDGTSLAATAANLERLLHEYERTERRVRALENVVLPEIRTELAAMEEYLDLNEQEEVIRVRTVRDRASGHATGAA
jgi:V/A-type H+-transporting ATPase subunit D